MELNREQIIKALECLNDKHDRICDACPVCRLTDRGHRSCKHVILDEAVALIKELTEENERLSTALAEYDHKTAIRISEEYVTADAYEELQEQNERLREEVIEEYRQKVNTKMGKHTHLLGKEYVQRILREVKKEMVGNKDV